MANARRAGEKCTVCVFPPNEQKELAARIHREFVDMPGLKVTADQAIRMWSPGGDAAVEVLDQLVESSFLRFDEFGRYSRHHWRDEATL